MATTASRKRSKATTTCAVRVSPTGGDGYDGTCGQPVARVVGTTAMCEHHAEAFEAARDRPVLFGEERRRATAALTEAEARLALLPDTARAEARPGRARDDFAPRVEVDAEWLAGLWSQLDAVESGPSVA
jgi:hypothetical protein